MPRGSIKDAPVAMPTWSGFYLGAGVGYGHLIGENNYSDSSGDFSSTPSDSAAGGLGTLVIGFDRQVRERYVVGLFAELDWSSIKLDDSSPAGDFNFTVRNAYSIGGRAGYLMTPTSLLYMTAGYTWAKGKSNGYFDIVTDALELFPGATSLDLQGAFIGLGMETQLSRNVSLRGEVRYTMFDEVTTNSGTTTVGPIVDFVDSLDANLLTGRLAVVYKFNRD
jgi:outer membrane immunogenic protein